MTITIKRRPPPRARRRPVRARRVRIRASRRRSNSRTDARGYIVAVVVGLALVSGVNAAGGGPTPAAPAAPSPAATPFGGGPPGCTVDDPTTDGCLTATTAHALAEIERMFGGYRKGPKILSAGCWDAHAWNPSSDHPKGRACDFFFGKAGVFPVDPQLGYGWELAKWLRANAGPLRVRYVIFQGRIWQADDDRDVGGWGKPYNGGGVYDAADATGGHWDHVHVSFEE